MAAAIALAVVLIIAVAGMSLAMQSQRPLQTPGGARTPRPKSTRPTIAGRAAETRSGMAARARTRRPAPKAVPDPVPSEPEAVVDRGPAVPELLRRGVATDAKVVNVVDERVVGPVTRSRLTLRIEPEGVEGFEVSLRHAFPTTDARARVRVGGTIPVRYDRDQPRKVVIDTDPPTAGAAGPATSTGGAEASGPAPGTDTTPTGPEPGGDPGPGAVDGGDGPDTGA